MHEKIEKDWVWIWREVEYDTERVKARSKGRVRTDIGLELGSSYSHSERVDGRVDEVRIGGRDEDKI